MFIQCHVCVVVTRGDLKSWLIERYLGDMNQNPRQQVFNKCLYVTIYFLFSWREFYEWKKKIKIWHGLQWAAVTNGGRKTHPREEIYCCFSTAVKQLCPYRDVCSVTNVILLKVLVKFKLSNSLSFHSLVFNELFLVEVTTQWLFWNGLHSLGHFAGLYSGGDDAPPAGCYRSCHKKPFPKRQEEEKPLARVCPSWSSGQQPSFIVFIFSFSVLQTLV